MKAQKIPAIVIEMAEAIKSVRADSRYHGIVFTGRCRQYIKLANEIASAEDVEVEILSNKVKQISR